MSYISSPHFRVVHMRAPKSNSSNYFPYLALTLDGENVATIWAKINAKEIEIKCDWGTPSTDAHSGFLLNAALRSSEARIAFLEKEHQRTRIICEPSLKHLESKQIFEKHGYAFSDALSRFTKTLNSAQLRSLSDFKKELLARAKMLPKVGSGYLIDTKLDSKSKLSLLANEYSRLAWGLTGWARHASLAQDEKDAIDAYCSKTGTRVLEIGAGSGRITKYLTTKGLRLTATDYMDEIVTKLKSEFSDAKVKFVKDDISKSQLPDQEFDKVLLLENALGALPTTVRREQALSHIARSLKSGGQLILGVRSIGEVSADHLMIASQDSSFMGIYHIFSAAEVKHLLSKHFVIKHLWAGDERPAGGHELLVLAEKK